MAKMYYDDDADLSLLDGKTVGVIGFGSQGHAHALNLHDSGIRVVVGLHPGSRSRAKVEEAGLRVGSVDDVAEEADIIMVLAPDHLQKAIYDDHIAHGLREGQEPHVRARLQHPLQPDRGAAGCGRLDDRAQGPRPPSSGASTRTGAACRRSWPCTRTPARSPSRWRWPTPRALAARVAGVLETTFKEETETDLFGEQTVLCGGVTALMQTAFETLVEAGYQPESAYFETVHELKLIVDLIYEGGFQNMRFSISDTAEYGDYTRGPRVIDAHVRETMRQILREVQEGSFAREWILENQAGRPGFLKLREQAAPAPRRSGWARNCVA